MSDANTGIGKIKSVLNAHLGGSSARKGHAYRFLTIANFTIKMGSAQNAIRAMT